MAPENKTLNPECLQRFKSLEARMGSIEDKLSKDFVCKQHSGIEMSIKNIQWLLKVVLAAVIVQMVVLLGGIALFLITKGLS